MQALPADAKTLQIIQDFRCGIPGFSKRHFGIVGAWRLNRLAFGSDMLVAPLNFFLGLPNFLLRLLAVVLQLLRLKQASRWCLRRHLGMLTTVQRQVREAIYDQLLRLPAEAHRSTVQHQIANIAAEPVNTYLATRNVAADLTAGTLAAVAGWMMFQQFTPGSVSAGSVAAEWAAKQHAAGQFPLGEILGGWWYTVFTPELPVWLLVMCFAVVMGVIALVSAFAGLLHDPLQHWSGLHQRRLHQLLDAIEADLTILDSPGYRPRDTFYGRAYDVLDWVKGLLSW